MNGKSSLIDLGVATTVTRSVMLPGIVYDNYFGPCCMFWD